MSSNRRIPPPTPTRATARSRGGGQPPQADEPSSFELGETEERRVQRTGDRSPIPVPGDEEREAPLRASHSFGGRTLADLAGSPEEVEAHQKGYGPAIVILHDGVIGPGGAHARGQVISLSQLLGDNLMKALEKHDFEARRQLARYMSGEDPAIREASDQEAEFLGGEITFVEGEEELEEALDASQLNLREAQKQRDLMRDLIIASASDPDLDVRAELARILGEDAVPEVRRGAAGASKESRMNPDDPNPPKTGESASGRKRDPGFIRQGQESVEDSASPGPPLRPGTEIQGSNAGQEDDLEEGDFPMDEGEAEGGDGFAT